MRGASTRPRRARAGARAGGRRAPVMVVVVLMLVGVAWLLAGCGPKVGDTKEALVDEPFTSAAVTEVHLVMGEGKLVLSPGAAGLVSGTIRYNVERWKPEITRDDDGVTIKQGSTKSLSGTAEGVINEWDLELGQAPMRLKIEAGAYQGVFDLTGLNLQEVEIEDGASETEMIFSSPNPSQIERLRYTTGASTVSFSGLGNANLRSLEFAGGVGTYSFDFSGQLRSDAAARIELGVATVRILVPSTTKAEVRVTGMPTDVDTQGAWTTDGTTYSTPAVKTGGEGKTLTIELEVGASSITLITG